MRRALALVDRLAERTLLESGVADEMPVPLDRVLRSMRIGGPSEMEMLQDGRLELGESPRIYVRLDQPRARQRFTTAHELGHWLIEERPFARQLIDEIRAEFRSEEVFCDTFAGALLMPHNWINTSFRHHLSSETPRIDLVEAAARAAGVSMAAATIRMRDVLRMDHTLLSWGFGPGGWRFEGEAGLFPWERGLLRPTGDATLSISRIAFSENPPSSALLPLYVDGVDEEVECEVAVRSRGVLAMVDLSHRRAGSDSPRKIRTRFVADRATRGIA